MGIEDTYNGAASAMTFFNAYIQTVAEEIGMDKAVGLYTKMCENMGAMQGGMLKEQAGLEEFIGNYPSTQLRFVGRTFGEYAALNRAILDFYGRAAGSFARRIGRMSAR
ncbi:MAG: hypothetical protein JRF72_12370, partial [Deltaproteobacteria bacterium]|nr:hypothetical protein [Deltaproteobacteria bacterium]